MSACLLCRRLRVQVLVNLGPQPLANRFLERCDENDVKFDLTLGQCQACGMIQLMAPPPAVALKPRVNWVSYREPEGHLDDLADQICRLPGLTKDSVVAGVTAKDDSTIARMRNRGFARSWRIEPERDLSVEHPGAGPETIQDCLVPQNADCIARRLGHADILIARHVLEHAQNPQRLIAALTGLVKPEGCIVLELPDCGPALRAFDYTMIWEEHALYFTPALLESALAIWALSPVICRVYPYSNENSIVAVVRTSQPRAGGGGRLEAARRALAGGEEYASAFEPQRCRTKLALLEFRRKAGPIAVFGAGHLSCAWINYMGVAECIDFVSDDDPNKQGLFMPGSRLPILPSSELLRHQIKLCILGLNQESEIRVIGANADFVRQGGTFLSFFQRRPNSLLRE